MVKKALFVIAPENFRDEEYFETKANLRDFGFEVLTASRNCKVAKGKLGGQTTVELDISEIEKEIFDVLILVGGPGAIKLADDTELLSVIKKKFNEGKLIAAICIAPIILSNSGILKNKNATVFNDDNRFGEKFLMENGANYVQEDVVLDDTILTARGPEVIKNFSEEIVKYLNS